MKYYLDYISMLEDKFIEDNSFDGLVQHPGYEVDERIKKLTNDLRAMSSQEKDVLVKGLKIMSELGCYKSALSASINTAIVSDAKEPDNRYVHVRGSVLFENKKRVWVSHYAGDESKCIEENGRVSPGLKRHFRVFVVFKLVERLKKLAFGALEGE